MTMAELRACYEALGLGNVMTYIQSGNVLFRAPELDTAVWADKIARQIEADFGFETAVTLMEYDTLKQIAEGNPLANKDSAFLHVTFLFALPAEVNLEKLKARSVEGEEFVVADRAVYLYLPHGYARTKLNNGDLERALKVTATTRNCNTVNNLLQKAGELK